MAQKNRILIIDDNYEIALFMRTTLEIVLPDYQIKSVPSAEEGMLELDRGVNLLIADLKLPGMNGVEFIQRVRKKFQEMPIIVVTGEDRPKLHEQARAVGLDGFLRKPLEIDIFTQVVRRALGDEIPVDEKPAPPPQVVENLGNLRAESGAEFIMLVDLKGYCLASHGIVKKLDTEQVASLLTADLDTSFELARMLRARQPFTIHYQAGQRYDLYTANVGPNHLLVLLFAAQRGPSKLGTIWGYAHKAVKEILPLLSSFDEPVSELSREPEKKKTGKPIIEPLEPPVELEPLPRPRSVPAPVPALAEKSVQMKKAKGPVQPEKIKWPGKPEKLKEPTKPEKVKEVIQPEKVKEPVQLVKIELTPEEVDAFWDRVITKEDEGNVGTGGIKLQEALNQGLIPSDFNPE
ncbi:MAG: response regulator [Anaerolineales bacterium]|nr:response regulator [Anaerolineales bacterium]